MTFEEMQDMPIASLCLNCHGNGTYYDYDTSRIAIMRTRSLNHVKIAFYCDCEDGQLLKNKDTLLKAIDPNHRPAGRKYVRNQNAM